MLPSAGHAPSDLHVHSSHRVQMPGRPVADRIIANNTTPASISGRQAPRPFGRVAAHPACQSAALYIQRA